MLNLRLCRNFAKVWYFLIIELPTFSSATSSSYRQVVNATNLCAACSPDAVVSVRSQLDCNQRCSTWNPPCVAVNYFVNTKICQVFYTLPANYTPVPFCKTRLLYSFQAPMCTSSSQNLAYLKSTYESIPPYVSSSLAVDGSTNTNWFSQPCACTQSVASPWWAVDLQVIVKIATVIIYNRSDCCPERLHDFNIGVTNTSPALITPTPSNYETCATYVGPAPPGQVIVPCIAAGRFLVIHIPTTLPNFLTLCEVQVYNCQV